MAATISATIRNVIPAQRRLPVRKKTAMAARAAMGKAKRKPMTMIAMRPIMSRTMRSHQNCGSLRLGITCNANKTSPSSLQSAKN